VRPEKTSIVEDLLTRLQQSPFLIITDYHGLKVDQFSDLRTKLAATGARYTVVKNTFLTRAAKEVGLPDLTAHLSGQTAIVTGDSDVSAAAKVLRAFADSSKKLTVRAGVVERSLFTDKQMSALADLPSKEALQSQLLGLLQAPATQLLRTLNEPGASLARLLQASLDKQQAPAPAEAAAA
jgi:large subunit ribosomal protein L10